MRSLVAAIFFVLEVRSIAGGGGLSYDFYWRSCPQVETIVRAGVQSLPLTDPTLPAALLRLMFHDCQVQGCDASILVDYDNTTGMPLEMGSTKNFGIRKRESIGIIKSTVESVCPSQVSCADILILAAREAVAVSGGPWIRVPLGRRDSSTTTSYQLADTSLPPADLGVDGMLLMFANKGMTVEESVAIMGSHTLGVAHCYNILRGVEGIHDIKAMLVKLSCLSNTSIVANDPTTFTFDNIYYVNAVEGRGVLRIDADMPVYPRTAPFVARFAVDLYAFFRAFSSAFVKLSSSGVLTSDEGVIRKTCNVLN